MSHWEAIVLGLIQGLTEFLPVSSSGHLELGKSLFGLAEVDLTFSILVHGATACSTLVVFLNDIAHTAAPGTYTVSQGQVTVLGLKTADADDLTSNAQATPNMFAAVAYDAVNLLAFVMTKTGIDRKAIRDYVAGNTHDTVIGKIKFNGSENVATPGSVSQWQKGEFEVIWPKVANSDNHSWDHHVGLPKRMKDQSAPMLDQGLSALVRKPTTGTVPSNWRPYLEKLPNDPWSRPYQYLNPGVQGEIDVMSFGADGVAGGEGKNADIGSWQ